MIQIEHLTKVYGHPEHVALRDVSLHVPKGRVFGLLGPNGAGKTTLISILAGVLRKTRGKVVIDGLDLDESPAEIKSRIGYVPQHLAFYQTLSARENLAFYAGVLGLKGELKRRRVDECVEVADLAKHLDRRAGTFSGGLKRRLNLAIGLLNAPTLLYLDEPTVGIDPQSRHFILQSLRALQAKGVTIIYTSHYMDEVQQICDELAIIDSGRIVVHGPVAELLKEAGADTLTVDLDGAGEGARAALETALGVPVREDGPMSFSMTASEDVLAGLLAHCRQRGYSVKRLRYGAQDLEELYLQLTHRALRE